MNMKVGKKIVFDEYDRVKQRLIDKKGYLKVFTDEDNIYGISKYRYKDLFENKTFEITGIRENDETFYVGIVEGYNFVFDISFIKKNMVDIDNSLFKL